MITIDWILLVGMLAGTASLSALLGLVMGMGGRWIHNCLAQRKQAKKSIHSLLCERCQYGRFGLPDFTVQPCRECLSCTGIQYKRRE